MIRRSKRTKPPEIDDSGQDSFLDIITNVVGVLVILVLVVGVRASRLPSQADLAPEEIPEKTEVADDSRGKVLEARAASLSSQIVEAMLQAQSVGSDAMALQRSRDDFQILVARAESEIGNRRTQLDTEAQHDFDLQTRIQASRQQLTELMQQKLALDLHQPKSVKIDNLPTPLSRAVDQQELHFQLRRGRIAYVPIDPLANALKAEVQQELKQLLVEGRQERVRTLGPIGGFRMRYYLQRIDLPVGRQYELSMRSPAASLRKWELLPVSEELGETVEEALAEGSDFRRTLLLNSPSKVTVTIWTYPDSFEAFRRLKKVMYTAGYQTASRPLPAGQRIAASPNGTRSAAQ